MSLVATGADGHGVHEENEMPELEKEVKLAVATEMKDFWRGIVISACAAVVAILIGVFMIVNTIASSKTEGTEKLMVSKIEGLEKKIDAKFDGLEKTMNTKMDGLDKKIDAQQAILADIQKKLTK